MRFSKSSVKLTLCAGRLPNKQSHVLFKKQAHPVKRIHFTDVKTTQTISNDFSTILVQKDFKNGLEGEVPASSIKGNQNIFNSFDSQDLPKGYQAARGFYQIFKPSTFVQWARCPPGTQPGQQTQGFNLYIFLQQREFNVFWVKIGK